MYSCKEFMYIIHSVRAMNRAVIRLLLLLKTPCKNNQICVTLVYLLGLPG